MKDFRFIDLFCGGGGSITGEIAALKKAGIAYDGRGFNHWDLAIRTIQANHPEIVPDFERACADIATSGAIGVVQPFLMAYYGNGFTVPVSDPTPTISTKDRFGLVQGRILTMPDGQRYKLDITHRMLTAKELAAATGFPDGYIFAGCDTDAKKMIGNAVCPDLAEALVRATLAA